MTKTTTKQKLQGAYYTPQKLVDFLISWTINSKKCQLLEPSCGDGIFLKSAYQRFIEMGASSKNALSNITAIELDPIAFNKTQEQINALSKTSQNEAKLFNDDFFSIFQKKLFNKKFDSVIGNPPFIRYQNFDEKIRERALDLLKEFGFKGSKLTNIWMPFLVLSSVLLSKNGKLGMIIPAELLQVNYASDLREFLALHFTSITIFTFRKLVFPGIQQEIVLLLAEKTSKNHGIKVIELNNIDDLPKNNFSLINKKGLTSINHTTDKWTQYFLTESEILLLRKLKQNKSIRPLIDFAEVDVGIVTGRNEFFVVNNTIVKTNSLKQYCIPIVGRTLHIKSINFTKNDWKENNKNEFNCNLLNFNNTTYSKLNKKTQQYIIDGEKQNFHLGFKCRIRKSWYNVPSVWVPDAFMYRQINAHPRLILNESNATTTDTIHRVRINDDIDKKSFVACYHNSLTFAFAEIMGRSYGGGVLELEPNEAEKLPIPYFKLSSKFFSELTDLLRKENSMEQILEITDKTILIDKMRLSKSEVLKLRQIRKKLAERRLERRHYKNNK